MGVVNAWRRLFSPKDRAVVAAAAAGIEKKSVRERMADWDRLEAEGATAALAGGTYDLNPYDKATQSDEWNFWVYGFSNAAGEMEVIKTGKTYGLCSTAAFVEPQIIDAIEAYRAGQWKPKYATVPSSWEKKVEWRSTT